MEREDRYIVLKRRDIESALSSKEKEYLDDICLQVDQCREHCGKEKLKCVVVESDWPEYEPTWQSIAKRIDSE